MAHHRETAYALLRVTLGIILLFYGIGKFKNGIGNFVNGLDQQFTGKLPAVTVLAFAYTIPFAEAILGALILLGLFTRFALTLSGLLLLGLTFGMVILGQPQVVANNLVYVLINFVLLWFSDSNLYSVDHFIQRKQPAGFTADSR